MNDFVLAARHMRRLLGLSLAVATAFVLTPRVSDAYSVQTHEQLIDLAWKGSIVPLLKDRFPGLTDAQLQEAHAYAYGGCAVQDLGYYPFGKPFFSDLTHYVRPADLCLPWFGMRRRRMNWRLRSEHFRTMWEIFAGIRLR